MPGSSSTTRIAACARSGLKYVSADGGFAAAPGASGLALEDIDTSPLEDGLSQSTPRMQARCGRDPGRSYNDCTTARASTGTAKLGGSLGAQPGWR